MGGEKEMKKYSLGEMCTIGGLENIYSFIWLLVKSLSQWHLYIDQFQIFQKLLRL